MLAEQGSLVRHTCANCGKPAARPCKGCEDAPRMNGEQIPDVYYCSNDCQTAHFSAHKAICEKLGMRRTLFRAGEVIQQAFFNYREHCYESKLSAKATNNNVTYLHEESPEAYQIGGNFPDHLFPDDNERAAALSLNACVDSLAYTHKLIAGALRGKTQSGTLLQT